MWSTRSALLDARPNEFSNHPDETGLMKQIRLLAPLVVGSALVLPRLAAALASASNPPSMTNCRCLYRRTAADVPGPVAGNTMTNAYVQLVGRMAYVWGYPLVNAHNRRAAFAEAPEPGLLGGVVPIAPIGFNQMLTDYSSRIRPSSFVRTRMSRTAEDFTALDKEPTVLQVPDFGDRFYVYAMYDQRTDEIGRIGKQYGTKPGFYMIVGPRWTGELPKGITAVVRSSTDRVFVVPRVFKDSTPEDTEAVQPVIDQIVMYPLSQYRRHDEEKRLPQVAALSGSFCGCPHAEGRKQVGEPPNLL